MVHSLDVFANPAVTIARSISDTFAGIAPGGVMAFVAAQLAGTMAALMTSHDRVAGREPGAIVLFCYDRHHQNAYTSQRVSLTEGIH